MSISRIIASKMIIITELTPAESRLTGRLEKNVDFALLALLWSHDFFLLFKKVGQFLDHAT